MFPGVGGVIWLARCCSRGGFVSNSGTWRFRLMGIVLQAFPLDCQQRADTVPVPHLSGSGFTFCPFELDQ